MRIQTKYLLLATLCVVVIVFAGIFLISSGDQTTNIDGYENQMRVTTELGEQYSAMQALGMELIDGYIQEVAADPENISLIQSRTEDLYLNVPSLGYSMFVNASGYVVAGSPVVVENYIGTYIPNEDIPLDAQKFDFLLVPHPTLGKSTAVIIPAFAENGGTYIGSFVCEVNQRYYLDPLPRYYNNTEGYSIWIIMPDGTILMTPLPGMLGKNIMELNTPDVAGVLRTFEKVLEEDTGSAVYTAYSYAVQKPADYLATWYTIPLTSDGKSSVILMISSKLPERQSSGEVIPSTNKNLEEFIQDAYLYALEVGREKALREFGSMSGQFTTKEHYVYAIDADNVILANPYFPEVVGYPNTYVDSNGVKFGNLVNTRARQGGGYVVYAYPDPSHNMAERLKTAYVMPVDESWSIIVGEYLDTPFVQMDVPMKDHLSLYLRSVEVYAPSTDQKTALSVLNDPSGPYYPENLRFYALDKNGTVLADPEYPDQVGQNILGKTTILGSSVTRDQITMASQGGGWRYALTPRENMDEASFDIRLQYILPVNEDWFVVAETELQ